MSRRRRLLIAGLLAAPLLLALLLTAVVLMLPAERIGAFAAARAEVALGREVGVERFRIRVLPRPAIALEGVTIAGMEAGAEPFVTAARVELRPRLLPLLRRRVIVDELVLESPRVRVEVMADGTTNVPVVTAEEEGAPAGDAELRIRRLRVKDGHIAYRDLGTGAIADLAGLEQDLRLSGSFLGGELSRMSVEGTLVIGGIDAELPGVLAFPVRGVKLSVEHRLELDRAADRLDIGRLTLGVQEVELAVTGSVAALTDGAARTLSLHAATGTFDVARLIASLPRSLLESGNGDALMGAAGRASVEASVMGRAGDGAVPEVNGVLRLDDVALARRRAGSLARDITGAVVFSNDSVTTGGLEGTLMGEPLRLAFRVHDLAAPHGRVEVRTAVALAEAQRMGLLGEDARATGKVTVNLVAEGAALQAAEALLTGSIGLSGVELTTTALQQPVLVESGVIELRGRDAGALDVRARSGRSDAALDFQVKEWLPYLLGDSARPPVITFDARSNLFDADEIFGLAADEYTYGELFFARLADRPVNGLTAAQAAEKIGLGMPEVPPVQLDGRIRAARFVRGATAFDEVDVSVGARGGELEVRAASFLMMGGGVHLRGRLGLAAGGVQDGRTQPLVLDYTVSDVTADAFLERFTAFRGRVGGAMLLAGDVRMNLDNHLLPVTESVGGAGTIAIVEGRLSNWPLLRELGQRLGMSTLDTLSFRDWTGRFRIAGGSVALEETMLESATLAVRAAGSFQLSGALDIGATVYVPQQQASRIPGAPAAFLVSAVSNADGRVPIGARIGGTVDAPSVRLDLTEAGALVANRAREAAQSEARELADRIADDLTERLPPRDSIAAAADSLRSKVQQDLQNRLRRILPGGG
jgi:hypothetical protein